MISENKKITEISAMSESIEMATGLEIYIGSFHQKVIHSM